MDNIDHESFDESQVACRQFTTIEKLDLCQRFCTFQELLKFGIEFEK